MQKWLATSIFRLCRLFFLACPLDHLQAQPTDSNNDPIANQFEHLSVADGLSSDYVTAILQDREGYMWFGTGDGLNKYDGSSFTVFKPNPDHPTRSFQNGYIMGLCEGDSTQLWAVTNGGGLHEINRKTGLVTPHPIRAAQANRWNTQFSVYQDRQHLIWISTSAGLARYNPNRHRFTLFPSPVAGVPVITVFEDRQHRFWVATHQGLYLFNRTTGTFRLIPVQGLTGAQPSFKSFYQDPQDVLWLGSALAGYSLFKLDLRQQSWTLTPYNPGGQLHSYVWHNTLHRDSKGLIWMGTSTGLQCINPASHRIFTYQSDPNRFKGLSSSNAQAVYHDRSGMLWVGTDNGIDRQAASTTPFTSYQLKPNERMASVPENRAFAVFKDQKGQLWFNNAPTLYRLAADQQRVERMVPHHMATGEYHSNEVTSFLPDESDGIWMGSFHGLYHYNSSTGQFTGYPSKISAQFIAVRQKEGKPQGDIWIGGDGGFASFNTRSHQYTYYPSQPGDPNGIPDKDVYGLLVSQSGEVWIVIHRMGLCRLNPKTGQMTRFSADLPGQLSSNDVRTLFEDRNGLLWVGTHRGGLNRYDPNTGRFSTITYQDGIPGTTILAITQDASGHLWLSTNDGLCRVNPDTKAIHTYKLPDGLPSTNFKQNAVFRQGDQLIFGSENGIVLFNPARVHEDTRPFPVYINRLMVLDRPWPLTDSVIQLKHDENLLSIGFAALAYEHPQQNQYAYQLVGLNKDWVSNGNRTSVNFNSLVPGQYTFRVKAANSHGFWTKQEASLYLIVQPPWWATTWAYSLYALLLGGAIWGYIRFSTRRIQQRQELELNRRQTQQLKAIDELKTRFFSNITHEFRTPLSLIIAPAEQMLLKERDEYDRSLLASIHRNANQLLLLINQLLDLARLEGDYMSITPMRGAVSEFIVQVIAVFQQAADHKGINLTYSIDHLPTGDYLFDADKWEKILTNLLANALKFTPPGGRVTLTAEPVWKAETMTGIEFKLTDTGIGIDPLQLPHIFDRFYQADTSTTRAYEGTGLGLALVQELVQLLEGQITVTSQIEAGTTFHWVLPVGQVSAEIDVPAMKGAGSPSVTTVPQLQQKVTALTKPPREPQTRPQILIVEDNEELRTFLVAELAASYDILQAGDGHNGWETAQSELPDIVLTDVMMPRMDGYELCRRIKNDGDTDHIAVLMLTAKTAQPNRLQGLQQGADDYLPKPFSMTELKLRIQNLLHRQQRLRERFQHEFSAISTPDSEEKTLHPFLKRIYDLLDAQLDDPQLGVEWLADQLAMSRRTLHRKLIQITPWPPNELIRQYRIRKAIEYLRSGHNVAETADRVGFSTPSHFSSVFKEIHLQTPTEFMSSLVKNT